MHLTGFLQSDRPGRTLGRGWAFALLVLVGVGQPLGLSHGAEGNAKMRNWETSAAWRKFKAVYTLAHVTNSVRELAKLERELDANEDALGRAFGQHFGIAQDLYAALSAHISDRTNALRPPRGKRLAHWREGLVRVLETFVHESNALRALRDLGAQDPWIDKELGASVKVFCVAVSEGIVLLERYEPNEPTTAPLVAKAREAIASAQDLLPPPGRPPTDAK
jgi:hypothetical protein